MLTFARPCAEKCPVKGNIPDDKNFLPRKEELVCPESLEDRSVQSVCPFERLLCTSRCRPGIRQILPVDLQLSPRRAVIKVRRHCGVILKAGTENERRSGNVA